MIEYVLKRKGTLVVSVRDLFNSRKRVQSTSTPTFYADSEFQWRERSFNLSFTYRFNQTKKQHTQHQSKQHTTIYSQPTNTHRNTHTQEKHMAR